MDGEPGPTLIEADPTGGLMKMAKLYADDRKIEATRCKLSLEDKRRSLRARSPSRVDETAGAGFHLEAGSP